MAGDVLETKSEAIRDLRDAMATLRWELICNQPILHRADITPEQLQKEMYRVIDDYPPLNWEYESSCIYHPYPQAEILPPGLIPKRENAFLFRKN